MSDLEKVINSIAEGDGLSTALAKHEPEPCCPHCGEPMDEIGTSISVTLLRQKDGVWVRDTIDRLDVKQCLNCFEELSPEELDELGVPNEIR